MPVTMFKHLPFNAGKTDNLDRLCLEITLRERRAAMHYSVSLENIVIILMLCNIYTDSRYIITSQVLNYKRVSFVTMCWND